jgi:GNAT superfamily N-acetyltransferase
VIRLRVCGEDDWALWRDIRLAALAEAPSAFGSTLADWQDADESRWRERLRSVPYNVVVELDGTPAGMASGVPEDHAILLISMWVAPFARGRGVGDRLIESVAGWARDRDARSVVLDVVSDNLPALALYLRNGFVDAGASDRDAIAGVPQRQMVFDL